MSNEAIVLAGGIGSRLKSVVHDKPKPMAIVNGKPFLEYLLKYLSKNGITHVILSVGFKAEQIQEYFGNKYSNIEVSYAVEKEPLGTGGGIRLALQKVKSGNVFIVNGDTLFNVNLRKLEKFHSLNSAHCSIALKEVEDGSRYGTITTNQSGKILSFEEKTEGKNKAFINGGTYLISKESFINNVFPEKFSFEKDFLEKYNAEGKFYGILFNEYFIDIGIPETFKQAQIDFLNEFES